MKCKNCFRDLNPKPDTIMIVCVCGETNDLKKRGGENELCN